MLCMLMAASILSALQDEPASLTAEQQAAQLKGRTDGAWLSLGTLNGFCSKAYAMEDVLIFCDIKEFGEQRLMNPFPESYKPTWAETFETIARQTGTSWSYSKKHGGWLFAKPALAAPYTFELSKGWSKEDRGLYLFCKPPDAPVGMDVYLLGTYSFEKDADKEMVRIRDAWALQFLKRIKPDAKIEDMTKLQVAGTEALHLETPGPKAGVVWRQWVFVKAGRAFAIVSALDSGKDALVKDVRAMVTSFKVVEDGKK